MYGLSTALPQKLKSSRRKDAPSVAKAEQKVAQKATKKVAKKVEPKTKRVFKEEIASPETLRAIAAGEAEIARGDFFTLEEFEAKYCLNKKIKK